MRLRITFYTIRRSVVQAGALSLMILYLAGIPSLSLIHSVFHSHTIWLNSAVNHEHHSCHQSIYDVDAHQGRDHASYGVDIEKCQLCDLACQSDQSDSSHLRFFIGTHYSDCFCCYLLTLYTQWAVTSSSRGPPILA